MFFISFYERTGSTYLVEMLDSHPDVVCHAEAFYLDISSGKPTRAISNVEERLSDIYDGPGERGFKFKYPHQQNFYPDVWQYLRERDAKVIFLSRENRLKLAISKQNQTLLWREFGKSNITQHRERPKLHLDVAGAMDYMNRNEQDDEYYWNVAKNLECHRVRYEELLMSPVETMRKVYKFLFVSEKHTPTTNMQKITDDNIERAVSNYGELVEAVRGTKYEKYLYS